MLVGLLGSRQIHTHTHTHTHTHPTSGYQGDPTLFKTRETKLHVGPEIYRHSFDHGSGSRRFLRSLGPCRQASPAGRRGRSYGTPWLLGHRTLWCPHFPENKAQKQPLWSCSLLCPGQIWAHPQVEAGASAFRDFLCWFGRQA